MPQDACKMLPTSPSESKFQRFCLLLWYMWLQRSTLQRASRSLLRQVPKSGQDGPRALQDGPRCGQDAAKTRQEPSKMRPNRSKRGDRGLQSPLGSIFGRFFVPTCSPRSTKIDEKSMPRCLPLLTPFFDRF